MKLKLAGLAVLTGLVFLVVPSFADTLTFVSVGGDSAGGEYVYPYNFSMDSSSHLTSLMCLDMNRTITTGETWNVTASSVPLDNSQTSIDLRAEAWIFSQLGTSSNADVQFAAWSIFDPTDAKNSSAFDAAAQALAETGLQMAQTQTLISSGFFSGYTLYIPTDDQAGWTDGIPQRFIGTAQAPEPSSLILLGSGLIGITGSMRRRLARA